MAAPNPLEVPPRTVLVVVDDAGLAELLLEALRDEGHEGALALGADEAAAAIADRLFDAAIIDLDTRARNGAEIIRMIRILAPNTKVIALLPCGGLGGAARPSPQYHLAIEKPARLKALLSALAIATSSSATEIATNK